MRVLVMLSMVGILVACQEQRITTEGTQQISSENQIDVQDNAALSSKKLACRVKNSPPIQDKTKIKEMLFASGKITAEMSPLQVDKVINDFIRNKQQVSQRCKGE